MATRAGPPPARLDAAEGWLHDRRRKLAEWASDASAGESRRLLARGIGGLEALLAAGALTAPEADRWRAALEAAAAGVTPPPALGPAAPAAAQRHLEALLACVSEDDEASLERFEGALDLLARLRVVDAVEWDARRRARLGWPSAAEEWAAESAGGSEIELVAVLAGPPERVRGRRLVVVLRFSDGLSFLIDKTEDASWGLERFELRDDVGTTYEPGGAGGGARFEHVHFRTAPPPEATWIDLAPAGAPDARFRVRL